MELLKNSTNLKYSEFTKEDLKDNYRETLNFSCNTPFGHEIEYRNANHNALTSYLKLNYPDWLNKEEYSISKDDLDPFLNDEINSFHLTNNPKYLEELRNICQYLRTHIIDKQYIFNTKNLTEKVPLLYFLININCDRLCGLNFNNLVKRPSNTIEIRSIKVL